jgi:hypothetical protein
MWWCSDRKRSILGTESIALRKPIHSEDASETGSPTSCPKAFLRISTRADKALHARRRQLASTTRAGGSSPCGWIPARQSKCSCNRSARTARYGNRCGSKTEMVNPHGQHRNRSMRSLLVPSGSA